MKKRINGVLLLLMSITMLFSACSKTRNETNHDRSGSKVGDILVYTMLMNRWTDRVRLDAVSRWSVSQETDKQKCRASRLRNDAVCNDDVYTFPAFGHKVMKM